MNLKTLCVPLFTGLVILTGCKSDDIPGPDANELYNREFIKRFGLNALDQNYWNHARQTSVTVASVKPTDVKIYVKVGGKRYLCADYHNVCGTQAIDIDVPSDVKDLIVLANGRESIVPLGSRIDLDSREATDGELPSGGVSIAVNDNYRYIPTAVVMSYINMLPENGFNFGVEDVSYNFSFVSDGPFTFYPIYWDTNSQHRLGVFWYDEGHYGDKDYYHEQHVYTTKTGLLQHYDGVWPGFNTEDVTIPATEETWTDVAAKEKLTAYNFDKDNTLPEAELEALVAQYAEAHVGKEWVNPWDSNDKGWTVKSVEKASDYSYPYNAKWDVYVGRYVPAQPEQFYPAGTYDPSDQSKWLHAELYGPSHKDENRYIRTKGITVDLPVGTRFGLYIDVQANVYDSRIYHRCYSSASHNQKDPASIFNYDKSGIGTAPTADENGWQKGQNNNVPDNSYCTSSYFTTTTYIEGEEKPRVRTFFGFEDWGHNEVDFNDVLFMVDEASVPEEDDFIDEDKPKQPEDEWLSWIVAAEDLGRGDAIGDWDFNDVVVRISACKTEEGTKLKVQPLASGGTIPVYLMYTGEILDDADHTETGTYLLGGGELHSWLKPGAPFDKPLNIGASVGEDSFGEAIEFMVPGTFTMTAHKMGGDWAIDNMGGFWFVADRDNKWNPSGLSPLYHYFDSPDALPHGMTKIIPPTPGNDVAAPQMICVDDDWCWPVEGCPIDAAYSGFLNIEGAGWYRDGENHLHDDSKVTLRH